MKMRNSKKYLIGMALLFCGCFAAWADELVSDQDLGKPGSECEAARQAVLASHRWHRWRKARKDFPLAAWSYFHRFGGTVEEYRAYKGAKMTFVQAPLNQAENAKAAGLQLSLGAFQSVHEDNLLLESILRYANAHSESVMAFSLKDEPTPADYPALAKTVAAIYRDDKSGAIPIINLRPNWAVPYSRWNMTYETHVQMFIEQVNPAVLLNCHYPLMRDGSTRPVFFSNLEYFRRLALKHDIGLMGFVQATAHSYEGNREIDYREPSESDLNWLVNSHLAYGAQGLWYYNWRIQDPRFSEALVDGKEGKPTPLYRLVQRANARVRALGATLLKLRSVTVVHTDKVVPPGTTRYAEGMIEGLSDFVGESFIIGQFENQDDPEDRAVYLMLVNKLHGAGIPSDQLVQAAAFRLVKDFDDVLVFNEVRQDFAKRNIQEGRIDVSLGGGQAVFLILQRR